MGKSVIVCGGGGLRTFSLPGLAAEREMLMEGACALCAGGGKLFCACGSAIWRLDAHTLAPSALMAGGPGICDMKLSADGKLLYALCGEADSVLMLDAEAGTPMLLNRAGLNPPRMALDADGETLAVAGGERGSIILFCARTLNRLAEWAMPGPVYDVTMGNGLVHALCLSETLQSLLVTVQKDGRRRICRLQDMPGALTYAHNALYAATQGRLYCALDTDASAALRMHMPGRAARMAWAGESLLLCDQYTQSLYAWTRAEGFRRICAQAEDLAIL